MPKTTSLVPLRAPEHADFPAHLLRAEWAELDRLSALLDRAYEDAASDDLSPPERSSSVQSIRALIGLVGAQRDRVRDARDRLTRMLAEQRNLAAWQQMEAEIYEGLWQQYASLGPQYQHIIRALAHAVVHLEQITRSGRDLPVKEWAMSLKAVNDCMLTLQRYTESRKVDITRDAEREAILKVVRVVEATIAPAHPELYETFVHALRDAIEAAS